MNALIDVTWRACACGHAGLVHRPSALGLALYGGLGRCELNTCGCDLFRPHGQSRYALVWHAKLTHRRDPRDTAGYAPPVLVPCLETISADALPHPGWRNATDNFWHGGPGHEITHKAVAIDRCGCGKFTHRFDDPSAPQVRELANLLWWTADNTKAADLLELVPVPPLVDEKPDPTPPVVRIGKAQLTITEDTAGDDAQVGERYVLNLTGTEMRCGVHVFMRPQTLVLPGEPGMQVVDVPHVYVAMEHPRRHPLVSVAADESGDHWINGEGDDA
jgi:hypothetical protein